MAEEPSSVEVTMPSQEMPAPPSYQQSIAVEDEPENTTDRTPLGKYTANLFSVEFKDLIA